MMCAYTHLVIMYVSKIYETNTYWLWLSSCEVKFNVIENVKEILIKVYIHEKKAMLTCCCQGVVVKNVRCHRDNERSAH